MYEQSITGKIVDPIPLPLSNVPIGLLPVGGDWVTQPTRTDANGAFRFFPIEPGDYVIVMRESGFQSQIRVVHVSSAETDVGTLKIKLFAGCESPIGNCNTVGTPAWPEAPVVDLCEALKTPDRYVSKLIVMVGMLTTVRGLASFDRDVRQHARFGRSDMDQRCAPTRRSRSPTVRDVPQCPGSEKEARGSFRSRQKDQRFRNWQSCSSLWVSRHTRRPPGRPVHRRFLFGSRFSDARRELSEGRWIPGTQVDLKATNDSPL
jgi:hypothetical protein